MNPTPINYDRVFGRLTVDCGVFDYSEFANCSEYIDFSKAISKPEPGSINNYKFGLCVAVGLITLLVVNSIIS
jgi:hypothetical protein